MSRVLWCEDDTEADGRMAPITVYRCQANCHWTQRNCSEKRKGESPLHSARPQKPSRRGACKPRGTRVLTGKIPTGFGYVDVYRDRNGSSWCVRSGVTGSSQATGYGRLESFMYCFCSAHSERIPLLLFPRLLQLCVSSNPASRILGKVDRNSLAEAKNSGGE